MMAGRRKRVVALRPTRRNDVGSVAGGAATGLLDDVDEPDPELSPAVSGSSPVWLPVSKLEESEEPLKSLPVEVSEDPL